MLQPESPRSHAVEADGPPTFEEFFGRNYVSVSKMMLLMTGSRQDAEDLAQEAFSRVFERWERVRRMDSPQGYLFRAAMNLNRKRARRESVLRRFRGRPNEPIDEIAIATARQDVRHALELLPRPQREALILVEWAGYDATEAGAILGIAPASVRGRLHRARNTLRTTLGERDG
jgi:RNA polymerase sigma factor (sigma-70 family)